MQRLFFRVNGDPFVQRHAPKTGAVQKDHGSGNENGHFPSASIRPLFENEAWYKALHKKKNVCILGCKFLCALIRLVGVIFNQVTNR